jgi:uncharacterized BrkB/YihY/UPF0761 family membrane protein
MILEAVAVIAALGISVFLAVWLFGLMLLLFHLPSRIAARRAYNEAKERGQPIWVHRHLLLFPVILAVAVLVAEFGISSMAPDTNRSE